MEKRRENGTNICNRKIVNLLMPEIFLSVDNVSGGMCKKKEVTQEYLERMY